MIQPSQHDEGSAMLNTAEELRSAQWALMDRIYSADNQDSTAANAEYSANIRRAGELGLLGTMSANDIDPDAYQLYSDCWKSENGSRPCGFVTQAEVQRYLAERRAGH
jgi:hypothetical protein